MVSIKINSVKENILNCVNTFTGNLKYESGDI